ncbi:SAM-dependent methyltransferase [Marinobacter fuscus]|uniref:SAM-dependent methyltransferase n=1 Tax=Marinobacter fuscus TaxID=2109942 RepID=A0A2T1K407_9GAMM|nr:class I SAM-dependent methyltransferase [Marinobacter fuscus]PSF04768.1 SAM-dependent methyltransferase [Marinobacter fuscus]
MADSGAPDFVSRHESFERWFQTPLGRALLASQRAVLDRELKAVTGARQLQVGLSHRLPLATGTDFAQRIIGCPAWHAHMPEGVAVCDAAELPFPGSSMDLVILHHTADFSTDPHQVLRESCRVLRGEGTIALIGFNPLSFWGVRRLLARQRLGPWGGRFLMRARMEDWLRLLGFELENSATYFCTLPLQRKKGGDRRYRVASQGKPHMLPVGAYYCILARKREYARIRPKLAWHQKKVITLPGAVSASGGCASKSSTSISECQIKQEQ